LTRTAPVEGSCPCLRPGGSVLKALVLSLCALALIAQAAAAAEIKQKPSPTPAKSTRSLSLEARLDLKLGMARKLRSAIRSFEARRSLTLAGEQGEVARTALRRAKRGLARATKEIAYYRGLIRMREQRQRMRRLIAAAPREAICGVFGPYCDEAIDVAWCESRLSTSARNGQYLGLFQMGSNERRLFGHGDSAHAQAVAAHRYFVRSGRDWSPWSCRWAAY
jgi:hypothetical protein